MIAETRVGNIVASDGTVNQARSGKSGESIVADGHARYQEAVYRGNVFSAVGTAIAILTVGATTYTGFVLSNPPASGKNLVVLNVSFNQTSAATTSADSVTLGFNSSGTAVTHTTAVAVNNMLLGSSIVGVGKADSGATIPVAAINLMPLWTPSVSATATTGIPPVVNFDVGGLIVLPPTAYLLIAATSALSGTIGMAWEEIPI